jgi:hypothetical protein
MSRTQSAVSALFTCRGLRGTLCHRERLSPSALRLSDRPRDRCVGARVASRGFTEEEIAVVEAVSTDVKADSAEDAVAHPFIRWPIR